MKGKFLIVLWYTFCALLGAALAIITCSCSSTSAQPETKNDRFTYIYKQYNAVEASVIIIEDTETGVQYLFVKSGYGAGLTVLCK